MLLNQRNTINEIEDSRCELVIVPLGSLEQHSSHLPVGTDTLLVEKLSQCVGEILDAYVLPVIPITNCYEHRGKKGSVWMRPSTLYLVIQDIVECLRRQGFQKIVFMIGHGGIFIAAPAIREINMRYNDIHVIILSSDPNEKIDKVLDCRNEVHAGEYETSEMLYLYEDLVKKDLMIQNDFIPNELRDFLNYTSILNISNTGAWGWPSHATKEKGEILFNMQVKSYVKRIHEVFEKLCKIDENKEMYK